MVGMLVMAISNSPSNRASVVRILIAITALSVLALFLGLDEARDVGELIRASRDQQSCEKHGDLDACFWVGLRGIQSAKTLEELRTAKSTLEQNCERGERRSCRAAIYVSTYSFRSWLERSEGVLDARRAEVAARKCTGGDARGCIVSAWFDKQSTVLDASQKLCAAGDTLGCQAWALAAARTHGADSEASAVARNASCASGHGGDCTIDRSERERCFDGRLDGCAQIEASGLDREVLTAIGAGRRTSAAGLYGVELQDRDYDAACARGGEIACFAAGLRLVGDGAQRNPPPLPDTPALDATLGRACDAGFLLACTTYAFRLLDRPVSEKRRLERARNLLKQGCDGGSRLACWWRFDEQRLANGDFTELRATSQRLCAQGLGAACATLYSILAADIDAAPWVVSETYGYVRLRAVCARGDGFACGSLGTMINQNRAYPLNTNVPTYRFTALSAAAVGCQSDSWGSCTLLLYLVQTFWPESLAEVKANVCEAQPRTCDWQWK